MKKLLAIFLSLWATSALAQSVNGPTANAGIYGAYNSSPPTATSGTFIIVQCDSSGQLKVH